jgi:peptidoglycan/LPS O-acetylase OafA/YrhL
MRIVLAFSVMAWHTVIVCYGSDAQAEAYKSYWRPLAALALPMFFALSGFLVAGSLDRTPSLTKFLGLRAIRIFPALAFETLVWALIAGPLLTAFALRNYFTDPLFYQYFWNIIGHVQFKLPGLFLFNPNPNTVNGQLWTVPYELECYISLAILAFFGIRKYPFLLVATVFAVGFALIIGKLIKHSGEATVTVGPVPGHMLVAVFLAGVFLYLKKDKIPYSLTLFLIAVALTALGLSLPLGDSIVAFPVAYVTVYLGMTNVRATFLHKIGDLSYGVFLFGYPIQQAAASLGAWAHHWYINLLLSIPAVIVLAAISWNFVEKPALQLRKYLPMLEPIDIKIEKLKLWLGRPTSGAATIDR